MVGDTSDQAEIGLVLPQLKRLKVDVVQTAINSVPDSDQAATNSEYALIAQKFQSAGANVVIAVGDAGVSWPEALQDNQSTYLPRLIVPDYSDLETVLASKSNSTGAEFDGALTAGGTPPPRSNGTTPPCGVASQSSAPSSPLP